MSQRILVIDDEESLCKFMQIMLSKEGYDVQTEQSAERAVEQIRTSPPDLVITDLMMPEMSGLDVISSVRQVDPDVPMIVMTAFASVETAIEALKRGAADYVTKPFQVEEIKLTIRKNLQHRRLAAENASLKKQIDDQRSFEAFIGSSPRIEKVKAIARQVASIDCTALIRGESGTGKDLLARLIHNNSPRTEGPFTAVNCGAIPESLLESELFGHVKGAFTGAVRDNDGLFRAAASGTLFLDEIGETTPALQVKLLRALEDKIITPVGTAQPVKVDVRLLAATNADLEEMVNVGAFRADLYYRLNVIQIDLPPLRERLDDFDPLLDHFLENACERLNLSQKRLSAKALKLLRRYRWPGNIRELANTIERACVLSKSNIIEESDFPERLHQEQAPGVVSERPAPTPTLETIEKAYIAWVLDQTGWRKSKAAGILGIDNSTLYRKIGKYKLARGNAESQPDASERTDN